MTSAWHAVSFPDTPVGQQLSAYLTALDTGDTTVMRDFITAHSAASFLDRMPAHIHAWDSAVVYHNTGGLLPVDIEEETPHRLCIVARPRAPLSARPAYCRLTIAVTSEAPHAILDVVCGPVLPPSRAVAVGGRRLAYTAMGQGSGSPTVVLEAGTGWGSDAWAWVVESIAAFTQVIAYDRAGLGASDPLAPAPRSSRDMAMDLHALLAAAAIPGPYVLVGHSFGGLLVRVFTVRYPEDVAGLVLVDPTHPEAWGGRELALLPLERPDEPSSIQVMRRWLTHEMYDVETAPEHLDVATTVSEGRACGSLGDRPLAVIHAAQYIRDPDLPPDITAKITRLREELHEDLCRLSSHSAYVVAEHSDHFVQFDEPQLVVSTVRQVVEAVRKAKSR